MPPPMGVEQVMLYCHAHFLADPGGDDFIWAFLCGVLVVACTVTRRACGSSPGMPLISSPPFKDLPNYSAAASFMILRIVASTSCATPSSDGVLNIASRLVGFKVARTALPPSS